MTTHRSGLRSLQVLASVVDGVALSTVVVYATRTLGLSATQISAILAGSAAVAMLVALLAGGLLDRIGLHRGAAAGSAVTALALLGYATVSGPIGLALSVAAFMSAQAWSGAARHGLAAVQVPTARRLGARAAMHTYLNAGLGAGTVLGVVLISGGANVLRSGYLAAALASAVAAVLVLRHRVPSPPVTATGGVLLALRDRRFALATALAVILQLTMPILSVLLPVWVVRHSTAPVWTSAVALAVNTGLVIMVQLRWSTRLRTDRATARSARWGAAGLVAMGVLLAGASSTGSGPVAFILVVAAVVGLTLGEIAGGAAVWRVALDAVPAGAEGRYQAAYAMSAGAARILGPLLALPLVLGAPRTGWLVLALAMAAAALAVGAMATRDSRSSDPTAHPRLVPVEAGQENAG